MNYLIKNTTNDIEYWSNTYGWVNITHADLFTEEEKITLILPLDGIWTEIDTLIYDFEEFTRKLLEMEYDLQDILNFKEYYQNLLPFNQNLADFIKYLDNPIDK